MGGPTVRGRAAPAFDDMPDASAPDSLPPEAVRVLDRLSAPSAPPTFTAADVLDALGSDGPPALTVAEVLGVLLGHELVSRAGELDGRPAYVAHADARPF